MGAVLEGDRLVTVASVIGWSVLVSRFNLDPPDFVHTNEEWVDSLRFTHDAIQEFHVKQGFVGDNPIICGDNGFDFFSQCVYYLGTRCKVVDSVESICWCFVSSLGGEQGLGIQLTVEL